MIFTMIFMGNKYEEYYMVIKKRHAKETVMKSSNKVNCYLIFSLSFLFLLASIASAQNMQEIKARMLNRKPTIDSLKDKGLIGEGVDGYLHIRNNTGDAKKVTDAENGDRRTVNGIIAKKEGATLDKVSRAVGAKLIQGTKPGHWVMKADGSWVQK